MTIHRLTQRTRLLEIPDMKGLFGVSQIVGVIDDSNAIYLIDSGLGPDHIREIVTSTDRPVHLILTHGHWDHIWGGEAITGNIYAHELTKETISPKDFKKFKRYHRGVTKLTYPTVTFSESLILGHLELFHTPGHTSDSISIWDPVDHMLFVGDNLFVEHRDRSLTKEHLASLKLYREFDFKYIIPAHIKAMERKHLEEAIHRLEGELTD